MKVKRAVLRTAAVLLGVAAVITGLEIGVRALGLAPQVRKQFRNYVRDDYLPHKPRPHCVISGSSPAGEFDYQYRHNSAGFRDVEYEKDKKPGFSGYWVSATVLPMGWG